LYIVKTGLGRVQERAELNFQKFSQKMESVKD